MAGGQTSKTSHGSTRTGRRSRPGSRTGSHGEKETTLVDEELHGRKHAEPDAVTADGLGPDEREDEDEEAVEGEDTGEHDYPIPEGWGADDQTNEEFWLKVFEIENAQEDGHKAFRAALNAHGFLSEGHFSWVRERYMESHGSDTDFQQAMMNARRAHNNAQLRQAVGAELLEPIGTTTLEIYASIQARRTVLSSQASFLKLLAEYGLDEKKWAFVDQAWRARMSDPANEAASSTVNAEYRKLFAAAAKRFGV